jgi:hypothetical protein
VRVRITINKETTGRPGESMMRRLILNRGLDRGVWRVRSFDSLTMFRRLPASFYFGGSVARVCPMYTLPGIFVAGITCRTSS